MKLNPDCIRDILLDIESATAIDKPWIYDSESPSERLAIYDKKEIAYQARYCMNAGLISTFRIYGDSDTLSASDLTPDGHEFISNIRSEHNWKKTKSILKNIGSESLDTIKQVAIGVITSLIQSQFSPK